MNYDTILDVCRQTLAKDLQVNMDNIPYYPWQSATVSFVRSKLNDTEATVEEIRQDFLEFIQEVKRAHNL